MRDDRNFDGAMRDENTSAGTGFQCSFWQAGCRIVSKVMAGKQKVTRYGRLTESCNVSQVRSGSYSAWGWMAVVKNSSGMRD